MRDRNSTKNLILATVRFLPVMACAVLAVLCIIHRDSITLENLLNYAPENLFHAFLFLMLLYALKSISVFFPMLILNIAGGMLFGGGMSIVINVIGVGIMTAIPYYIGLFSGAEGMERLLAKYKKLSDFVKKRESHVFFDSFFLRIISCLPGDIVSMYFGAAKSDFTKYFWGSMLGIVPGTITASLMGESIRDPLSPKFIISLSVTLLMSVMSIVIYRTSNKRKDSDI